MSSLVRQSNWIKKKQQNYVLAKNKFVWIQCLDHNKMKVNFIISRYGDDILSIKLL